MSSKSTLPKGVFWQIFSTCTINIINISHGATLGWVSPFLPLLQSDESPLDSGPVTVEQGSWIGSMLCVGTFVGTFVYGYLTSKLGVKRCIQCIIVSNTSFWILVFFGTSVYHLYLARFLAGFSGGGIMVTFPLYIADISDSRIRGMLGSGMALFGNLGILLIYVIGDRLSYRTVPIVMMSFPILFGIIMIFIPETPQTLLRQRKTDEAERSLRFYKGLGRNDNATSDFKREFQNLQIFVQDSKSETTKLQLRDFVSPQARKGILIGIFLMFLNLFCGVFAILTYAANIFQESGSDLSPTASAIVIGVVQIFGTIASFIFIDKAGRKILLLISTFGTAIGLSCLGVYSWLKTQNFDLTGFDWVPIVSLSFAVFLFCVGLCNIPFFIIPELLPAKICNVGNSISVISLTIFSFICLKILPTVIEEIHLYGAVGIFAIICCIGIIVIAVFIPETKGKNLVTSENV